VVLLVAVIVGGLWFLGEPFSYHGPAPCQDANECEPPFVECEPPLAGGDVTAASPSMASGAAARCSDGSRRRLLSAGAFAGAPIGLGLVRARLRRVGYLRGT
jgi:hypothetical protein